MRDREASLNRSLKHVDTTISVFRGHVPQGFFFKFRPSDPYILVVYFVER